QLAQLLPLEESFLLLFRFDNPLESSVEFMKVSRHILSIPFGTSGKGLSGSSIILCHQNAISRIRRNADESRAFVCRLVKTTERPAPLNKSRQMKVRATSHLSRISNVPLSSQGASKLTREDIERVFALYDRDKNGTIENEELKGFLKDLLELVKKVRVQIIPQ
ncbi:unnamed protein product, partial [Ixodes pacificus]